MSPFPVLRASCAGIAVSLALLVVCPAVRATPGLSREIFTGVPGATISDLLNSPSFYTVPSVSNVLQGSVSYTNYADNYGTRLRGYITAPATGSYTFWESGDDAVSLYLSIDVNPNNKRIIAFHTGSTGARQWDKYPTQKSAPIHLIAGSKYYIEVLHKEATGSDNLAISWSYNATNWAESSLGSTATQNSTGFGGVPSRAIDGNTDGAWSGASISHTNGEANSWLQVDLGADRPVNHVTLYNRTDAGTQSRLSNFRISLLGSDGMEITGQDFYRGTGYSPATTTWDLPASVQARKVLVKLLGNNNAGNGYLSIAELQALETTGLDFTTRTLIPVTALETYTPPPANPPGLTREIFTNIGGTQIANLTSSPAFYLTPDSTDIITSSAFFTNHGDNYGTRLRGYITAPTTGAYTFWECGDDAVSLALSTDDNPANRKTIASHTGWTAPLQWDKYTSQKSAAISLIAGKRYYIEVLHKEGGGSDNLAISWQQPGGTQELIPLQVMESYSRPATDLDDDGIPDALEVMYGLNPQDGSDALGDLDGDGISNHDAIQAFADPTAHESVQGRLVDEIWQDVPGDKMNEAAYKAAFTRPPSSLGSVSSLQASDEGDNYLRRIRGYITAPVSGDYTFWGAADDDFSFFLSTTSSKFDRKQIIENNVLSSGTNFDVDISQKSRPVTLVAGRKYYFELYHKEGLGGSSVAMAWKTPNGSRELIPSMFLSSYAGEANDQDDDYLKDDWELANGLNPADDGKSPGSKDGAYGDLDGDGLTNLEEMKFGSKANLVDSDGDGVSDYDEANFYGSDLLAGDIGAFTTVATMPGDSFNASFGEWEKIGGKVMQHSRRGYIEYPVTVSQSGVYSLKFKISSLVDGGVDEQYDFNVSINGTPISRKTITIPEDGTNHLAVLTPWLNAGETYQVRLFADNSYNFRRVSVDSVEVLKAGGTDSNNNGIPDWVDIRLHKTNGFDKASIYSKTSPATVEGNARFPGLLQTNGVTITQAPEGRFFTDIPLTPITPTTLTFGFENNALSASASVQWVPTNLQTENNITIRQNDSLLLTAFDDAEQAGLESYTLTANGQTASNTSDQPTPIVFAIPGTQTITVTHTSANGAVVSRGVTVNVIPLVSIPAPLCVTGYPRTWTYPALPSGAVLQIDGKVTTWKETTANTYTLLTTTPENQPVLIRQGANGPILGSSQIKSVCVRSDDMTGNLATESYPTYDVVELPVVVTGELDTAEIRCEIIIGGVTFTDGTTSKSLYVTSFDEAGTTKLYFDKPNSAHANCHRFSIWHNGNRVALL